MDTGFSGAVFQGVALSPLYVAGVFLDGLYMYHRVKVFLFGDSRHKPIDFHFATQLDYL